jgi:hypothetical protein
MKIGNLAIEEKERLEKLQSSSAYILYVYIIHRFSFFFGATKETCPDFKEFNFAR